MGFLSFLVLTRLKLFSFEIWLKVDDGTAPVDYDGDGLLSCHVTRGDGKWVHAPWDHELEDEHVGVWGGQRNGWSERLCSAFRSVRDGEALLTDEPEALIQDFPVIFFELVSNEKVVQAKSYALEVSLWFLNGTDFIVNAFETQGFTKALIINADLQGALIRFLSSFNSKIKGHESSESSSWLESISVSVIRRFCKEWSSQSRVRRIKESL
nr:hypothetical protein CFP56_44886 [Quercus suber]